MDLKERFENRGQGHVFGSWSDLGENERRELLEQAEEIDLDELEHLTATLVKGSGGAAKIDFAALKPAPYLPLPPEIQADPKWRSAKADGEAALRAGKVGVFLVAGGQGTRLGYDGPKGTFPVTPIKKKSLFQVFAEKIQAARIRYGASIPWYVMTSDINHGQTVAFFEENGYFGLSQDSVVFFRQGRMPAVDFDGKILMEGKARVAMSPDGHGGSLRALERSGALGDMERRGVEALSYIQVDNPLVQVIDPYFIGFHLQAVSQMSSKMLPKAYEKEKLGHFCEENGRMVVVEYSDMPDELTARRGADGELAFRAGSIAIHILATSFIRELTRKGSSVSLPFHKAEKKIPFLGADGSTVKPEKPNGVKFELFVFDAIPFAQNPIVLETTRLGDFSPVKNAEGIDSPASCAADQQKLFAGWLAESGAAVELDGDGMPVRPLEVAPSFGYNSETFAESWASRAPALSPGEANYLA